MNQTSKPKQNGFFITGTDTDCGKTYAASALIAHLAGHFQAQGGRVVGLKPIASGFELRGEQWLNNDVEAIKAASSVALPDDLRNRYSYKEPIAPHIAANIAGDKIDIGAISNDVDAAYSYADIVVVEGVGGWLVPLDQASNSSIKSLAEELALPVILVVGLRLGCLNHALLAIESIRKSNVNFLGWVANHVDPEYQYLDENIQTLKNSIDEPMLFELAYSSEPKGAVALKGVNTVLYSVLSIP